MRLLHTSTLKPTEFIGEVPFYSILSHRWEKEEMTFQDLTNDKERSLDGWSKIESCCRQAAQDGWEWTWIDTCCIDKTSSAELSEAINSMFRWYQEAQVCYAYLSDVSTEDQIRAVGSNFRQSKWFTRGWTLQELLAPPTLIFYCQDWKPLGTKSSLRNLVQEITKIRDLFNWEACSVAQKLSWASTRETTRVEDVAYSLMGLFGVHMPLLYGEGRNAFFRLQLEIFNRHDDESLFAWETDLSYRPFGSGILAPYHTLFKDSGGIIKKQVSQKPRFTMTSRGIDFKGEIYPTSVTIKNAFYHLPLHCGFGDLSTIGLVMDPSGDNVFQRRDNFIMPTSSSLYTLDENTIFQAYIPHVDNKYNENHVRIKQAHLSQIDLLRNGFRIRRIKTAFKEPQRIKASNKKVPQDSFNLSLIYLTAPTRPVDRLEACLWQSEDPMGIKASDNPSLELPSGRIVTASIRKRDGSDGLHWYIDFKIWPNKTASETEEHEATAQRKDDEYMQVKNQIEL